MIIFIIILLFFTLFIWKVYNENRQNILKQFKEFTPLPNLPIIGSAHLLYHSNGREFFELLKNIFLKYGNKFFFEIEFKKYFAFSDPTYVKAILTNKKLASKPIEYDYFQPWLGKCIFTSSGSMWRLKRKDFGAFINTRTVENTVKISERHTDQFIAAMEKHVDGKSFDVYHSIECFAMDAICEFALGLKFNSHVNPTEMQGFIEEIVKITMWRGIHPLARYEWYFSFTQKYKKYNELIRKCTLFMQSIIQATKKDVLETKLSRKDAESCLQFLCCESEDSAHLNDKDIQDEVQMIIFAGLDTSTSTLSFLTYLLGLHQDEQEKIYAEIQSNIDLNVPLTVKALNTLKYLEMFMKETYRMYPAVPVVLRKSLENIEINDIHLPADSTIGVGILDTNMNPNLFPKPYEFMPERHSIKKEHDTSPDVFTFCPGARNCMGTKIAEYELKTFTVKVLSKFKIELQENYQPDISWDIVLKPDNGVWIKLTPRNL